METTKKEMEEIQARLFELEKIALDIGVERRGLEKKLRKTEHEASLLEKAKTTLNSRLEVLNALLSSECLMNRRGGQGQ
jgi:cob(I)alamin adenosyltransferase